MANNAIALQARAPNTNFLGAAVRQNAAVINQMAQQQAAQRQAEQQRQTLALAQSREAREATAADIENARNRLTLHRDLASIVRTKAGYEGWLANVEKDSQQIADMFRANLPPEEFDRNPGAGLAALTQMVGTAEQNFNARYPKAISTAGQTPEGVWQSITTSGIPGASNAATVPDISRPRAGGVLATGDPIEAAAQAIVAGKTPRDPALQGLSDQQFGQAQQRAREIGAQPNPPLQPMSYSPGGQQPDLANIVQTMLDTGVVSQANVDAMRQAAGPGKDAQLAQILREHNIRIMPDEGMPGARMGGGEYDPARDAAAMQPAQYDPSQYEPARGKPPMQGPVPGVYNVPPGQVHEKAQAERETPKEVAARVTAEEGAKSAVEETKRRRDQRAAAEMFMRTAGVNLATGADPVSDLIKRSTSGTVERIGAAIVGGIPSDWGGGATEGAKAIGELETISAKLTSDLLQGKLGTGISNEDRNMIQRMLADMANPDVPSDKRLAAWNRVKTIQASYLDNNASGSREGWWGRAAPQKQVVRTGKTRDGRLVRQYSDGSIEYGR